VKLTLPAVICLGS